MVGRQELSIIVSPPDLRLWVSISHVWQLLEELIEESVSKI